MRILFYNDSPVFGGLEKSLFYVLEYLMERTDLHLGFIFYQGNTRFNQYLDQIAYKDKQRVTLYPINYYSGTVQCIKTLLSFSTINFIQNLLSIYNPDIVVIVQGSIELSSCGLIAAKKSGYKIISFIPMTFKFKDIGVFMGEVRDGINRYFYNLPDRFITVSFGMLKQLVQRGVPIQKVKVIYGVVDTRLDSAISKRDARIFYNLKENDYIIAIIGRVHFKQKGHDFLVRTLSENLNKLKDTKLLVVGDGPDLLALKSIVTIKKMNNFIQFIPWSQELYRIYSAIDMVVIPSYFEGMPLTMLEAIYYSLPVIASNRDGMKEILPEQWLFDCKNSDSLIQTIFRVKHMNKKEFIQQNKTKIHLEFSAEKFGKNFYNTILHL